jgi:hypothetical protein
VRDPLGGVAVRDRADVVPGQGVLAEPFPGLVLELKSVPLRDALLHPADQERGRVHPVHFDGLISGQQRDPRTGQVLLQPQRIERVPPGALDVLAHHRGEPRFGPGRFGQQVRHPAITRDAYLQAHVGGAASALVQVHPPGLHIPVVRGDEPPGRELGLHFAELPAQRLDRVLHDQGGGPAQERYRYGDRRGGSGGQCRDW